jgi:hypothetical protein
MDPLNTSDAPGTAVIRWAMRPPVQLSAAAILHPFARNALIRSLSTLVFSIGAPPASYYKKFYHRGGILSRDFPCVGDSDGV